MNTVEAGPDEHLLQYLDLMRERPDLFPAADDDGIALLTTDTEIAEAQATVAARLASQQLPPDWATVGIAYEDQYMMILRDAVRFADGQLGTYIRGVSSSRLPGAAILPVFGDEIVLLRHFRHATRAWHLEIPRGFSENDDPTPESVAIRELDEELGTTPASVIALGTVHPDAGFTAGEVNLFLATIDGWSEPAHAEGIGEVLTCSVDECARMIAGNLITDSFTIAAFARARFRNLV